MLELIENIMKLIKIKVPKRFMGLYYWISDLLSVYKCIVLLEGASVKSFKQFLCKAQTIYMLNYYIFRGMTVSSGSVSLTKDEKNLIGISIGGGAPLCPCLYVVQIFDNTPASKEGTLQSGDELVGVNGQSVKGRTKVEVARMIQSIKVTWLVTVNL